MGNEESTLDYKIKQYYDISKSNYEIIHQQHKRILRKKDDLIEEIEEYDVYYENKKYLDGMKAMTILRSQPKYRLIKILYFIPQQYQMCSSFYKAVIGIQRISKRLSDLKNHSYQKSMQLLQQILDGFEFLYEKYGLFRVTPNMIGMNNQKQTKVWHNENFSALFPGNYQCSSLQSMIQEIIYMVQQRSQKINNIPLFSEYVQRQTFQRYSRSYKTVKMGLQRYRRFYRLVPMFNTEESLSQTITSREEKEDIMPVHLFRQSFDFTGSSCLRQLNFDKETKDEVKQMNQTEYMKGMKGMESPTTKANLSSHDESVTICSSLNGRKLSLAKHKNIDNRFTSTNSQKINKNYLKPYKSSGISRKKNSVKSNTKKQTSSIYYDTNKETSRSNIAVKNKSKKAKENLDGPVHISELYRRHLQSNMKVSSPTPTAKFISL